MIKKIAFTLCIVLIFGCIVFYFFQEKFIFLNGKKLERDTPFTFKNSFNEVFLKTEDKQEISAIYFKKPSTKKVVLFFHGNKGNLSKWGKRVAYFLDYETDVFVIDYRNYGKSSGNFNEQKMYKDALLAYSYLKNFYQENEIIVYGYSLGATFAAKVASENNPKELILEAPFYNLKKALRYNFLLAPTFLLRYKFNTNSFYNKIQVPITIFHGDKDVTTSPKESKELFRLNNVKNSEYILVKGATHHNIREQIIYKKKLLEILKR